MFSCTQDLSDVQMHDMNGVWEKDNIQEFQFEINDAEIPKNIIFVVRNNNEYPYNNLFLISSVSKGKEVIGKIDTSNYRLANPDGTWIGSGFGDTKETKLQYKMNFKFPENGRYTFKLKQGMRQDSLMGIEDIGIKIQSTK